MDDRPTESKEPERKASLVDSIMRGTVLVLLGAVVTAPLWFRDEMATNFQPSVFRAERDNNIEDALTREIVSIIERAKNDEMVDEAEVVETLGALFEAEELGDARSRRREIERMVGEVVAQAAEMDGPGGFSNLQEEAIQGAARMKARSMLGNLGADIAVDDEPEVDGDWHALTWPALTGFTYEQGEALPASVRELDGQQVSAFGYFVALGQDQYLLVQNLWSCCFGAPPDVNEAIVVRAEGGSSYEGRGVRVYGTFDVGEEYDDEFVTSLYRIDAAHLRGL